MTVTFEDLAETLAEAVDPEGQRIAVSPDDLEQLRRQYDEACRLEGLNDDVPATHELVLSTTENAGEFFSRCERDDGGHCLPEGGSGSSEAKKVHDYLRRNHIELAPIEADSSGAYMRQLTDLYNEETGSNLSPQDLQRLSKGYVPIPGPSIQEQKTVGVFGGTPLERLGARVVAEEFPLAKRFGFGGIEMIPETEAKQFTVGRQTYTEGGHYTLSEQKCYSKALPNVLAHELAHDEFHFGLDCAQYAMNAAAERLGRLVGTDPFERKTGFFRMSGDIREPANAHERVYNALEAFKSSLKTDDDHPTGYSRSWAKERGTDESRVKERVKFKHGNNEWDVSVVAHRSANEAYAEFAMGQVLDKLKKDGMVADAREPSFKQMGTPASRKAFKELQKAIRDAYKERLVEQ